MTAIRWASPSRTSPSLPQPTSSTRPASTSRSHARSQTKYLPEPRSSRRAWQAEEWFSPQALNNPPSRRRALCRHAQPTRPTQKCSRETKWFYLPTSLFSPNMLSPIPTQDKTSHLLHRPITRPTPRAFWMHVGRVATSQWLRTSRNPITIQVVCKRFNRLSSKSDLGNSLQVEQGSRKQARLWVWTLRQWHSSPRAILQRSPSSRSCSSWAVEPRLAGRGKISAEK